MEFSRRRLALIALVLLATAPAEAARRLTGWARSTVRRSRPHGYCVIAVPCQDGARTQYIEPGSVPRRGTERGR